MGRRTIAKIHNFPLNATSFLRYLVMKSIMKALNRFLMSQRQVTLKP